MYLGGESFEVSGGSGVSGGVSGAVSGGVSGISLECCPSVPLDLAKIENAM